MRIFISLQNDERMHLYQRERTSITGWGFELRRIIETGRLVEVVMTRLVLQAFAVSIQMLIEILPCDSHRQWIYSISDHSYFL